MSLRYAILAAVSTRAQAAADRVSIPDQIQQSRAAASERGWVETAGPYIIPGASRTKYVNLSDAEREIPALHSAMDAAQHRVYDVLILYHLNRLRDLMDPIYRSLGVYGVQIYSLSQPVEPVPPDRYNYETSDTMRIIVTMTQMTSQAETADIRRRYNLGMPGRVINRGLPANSPPFGYRRALDRKSPPQLDPDLARIVIHIKDLYLGGSSLDQIARHLDERRVPPPRALRWNGATVRGILENPFYMGYVRWGVSRVVRDLRAGTRTRSRDVQPDKIAIVPGQHTPLWDDDTRTLILSKLKSRRRSGGKVITQFSGLLVCSLCGAKLWRQGNGPRGEHRLIWRCSQAMDHVNIPHVIALDRITEALTRHLRTGRTVQLTPLADQDDTEAALEKLRMQRQRWEDAYEAGAIDLTGLVQRTSRIDGQIRELSHRDNEARVTQTTRDAWLAAMGGADQIIELLPEYMAHEDPASVNRMLRLLLRHIIITPDHEITIVA